MCLLTVGLDKRVTLDLGKLQFPLRILMQTRLQQLFTFNPVTFDHLRSGPQANRPVQATSQWCSADTFVKLAIMAFVNGDTPDITGGGGPFQANTRIVAIIALTVAGVFVLIGLTLSLIRALQQRTAERVRNAICHL